jgi:hypothetical protein
MVSATTRQREQQRTGQRQMSREELLGLGRGDDSWSFVGNALAMLAREAGDDEIRLKAIEHACRLGLRTMAGDLCEGFAEGVRGQRDVADVQKRIEAMEDDRLAAGRLTRAVRAGCHVLAERGVDLRGEIDAWRARVENEAWCLAGDGNIVVRGVGGEWRWVRDSRGNVERMELPLVRRDLGAAPSMQEKPLYFDGLDGGWLLARVHRETPRASNGYQPRLHVVVEEVGELFDAMATGVLQDVCSDGRAEWFIGEEAIERFAAWLQERDGLIVHGPVFGGGGVSLIIEEMFKKQGSTSETLRGRIRSQYEEKDARYWAEQYEDIVAGRRAMRVVVISTTHSTFVRHWGEDVARAWRDAGHEVEVICEPDTHTLLAAPHYLRIVEEFEPDLVMLSNFTRGQLRNVLPENVPAVCWIQDRMAHLFDPEMVRTRGRFDYFYGHLYGEIFSQESMRRGSWASPVMVSSEKFHDGDVSDELRERFACDAAYVSHQSQSVEELYEESARAVAHVPLATRLLRDIKDDVLELFADTDDERMYRERFLFAGNVYRFSGKGKSAAMQQVPLQQLWYEFGARLAERAVRMQTLEWAAAICARRGWSMKLYGKGWEKHPTLGRFASGEIAHGEELRACYQCAGTHLHASAHTVSHQRVFECVLSGGLMLRRLAIEDLHRIEHEIARRQAEGAGHAWGEEIRVAAGANELFAWYAALRQRLGMSAKEEIVVRGKLLDAIRSKTPEPVEREALALLPGLERTVFGDEAGLERMLVAAREDEVMRSGCIESQRDVVGAMFTYDATVKQLPDMILEDLRGAH